MRRIIVCKKCGKMRPHKAHELCSTCYKKEHPKPLIICKVCGRERPYASLGLCSACYAKENRKQQPLIVCKICGRERPHAAHGLCAVCHVKEHRKENPGPVRACSECGKIGVIKARDRCSACYSRWYVKNRSPEVAARSREQSRVNRQGRKLQIHNYNIRWNREHTQWRKEYQKIYKTVNKARITDSTRLRLRKKCEEPGYLKTIRKIAVTPEEKMNSFLVQMPDMKRVRVEEFLHTAYKNRADSTKVKLVRHLTRLLSFVASIDPEAALGPWNTINAVHIERCQVETGQLKDSLRVFFHWLHRRKNIDVDLSKAVYSPKTRYRVPAVSADVIRQLIEKWANGNCGYNERIAGLMIIYYGMTCEELRNLKNADVNDWQILIDGRYYDIEPRLGELIKEYIDWKQKRFFGYAHEFFFVTGESVTKKAPVEYSYFAKHFKLNHVPVSPSHLRKAIIYLFKDQVQQINPFILGAVFRIHPRGATRYFEK